MRTKTSRHLSQKIENLVQVDGQLLTLGEVVREINDLNVRPVGDVHEVALASMIFVLKELRRRDAE